MLKGGGTEKRGGKTKILKRGASWVKGFAALKRGGGSGTPLDPLRLNIPIIFSMYSKSIDSFLYGGILTVSGSKLAIMRTDYFKERHLKVIK